MTNADRIASRDPVTITRVTFRHKPAVARYSSGRYAGKRRRTFSHKKHKRHKWFHHVGLSERLPERMIGAPNAQRRR